MCGPLSTGEVSHLRDLHQEMDVEDLPNNHKLRPLLAYARWESLSARVSFPSNCPSHHSLIIGNLPPLADRRRQDFERNPKWSEDGPMLTRASKRLAKAKDRWDNQAQRITRHHIQLVEDSLKMFEMAQSLKGVDESGFVFDVEPRYV
jgi:hypothetical protein